MKERKSSGPELNHQLRETLYGPLSYKYQALPPISVAVKTNAFVTPLSVSVPSRALSPYVVYSKTAYVLLYCNIYCLNNLYTLPSILSRHPILRLEPITMVRTIS